MRRPFSASDRSDTASSPPALVLCRRASGPPSLPRPRLRRGAIVSSHFTGCPRSRSPRFAPRPGDLDAPSLDLLIQAIFLWPLGFARRLGVRPDDLPAVAEGHQVPFTTKSRRILCPISPKQLKSHVLPVENV